MVQADPSLTRSLGQRLFFWDFRRASWQYDVVVGLILIFIFATPRTWFRDQPQPSNVQLLSSSHGSDAVFIAPELLANVPESERPGRAEAVLRRRTGKSWRVVRVEPLRDEAEKQIKGFIAYTAP